MEKLWGQFGICLLVHSVTVLLSPIQPLCVVSQDFSLFSIQRGRHPTEPGVTPAFQRPSTFLPLLHLSHAHVWKELGGVSTTNTTGASSASLSHRFSSPPSTPASSGKNKADDSGFCSSHRDLFKYLYFYMWGGSFINSDPVYVFSNSLIRNDDVWKLSVCHSQLFNLRWS